MQSYLERIRNHGQFTECAQEAIRQIPKRIGSRSEQFSAEIVPIMAVWFIVRWEMTLGKSLLVQCNGRVEEVEAAVESRLLQLPRVRPDPLVRVAEIPKEFSQAINDLVERSIELSKDWNTNWVGTEHLLFAALSMDSELSMSLKQFGVTYDKLKKSLDDLLTTSTSGSEE